MRRGRARVLIVDDNAEDLATYSRWLLAGADHRLTVLTASTAASGLAICAAYAPDCIVLDYDLRDSTGLDFMAELARREFDPPVVAITGSGSEALAVEFMKAGARDYLSKLRMSATDLCSAVAAQISPGAMRNQIGLFREREQTVNAALEAALGRVSFLAETGKLFAATRDYDALLALAATRAVPFLGEVCFVDLIEAGVLHRRSVRIDGDAALQSAATRTAMLAPHGDPSLGIGRAIRDAATVYVTGDALAQATRDDPDLAVLTGAGLAAAAFLPLLWSESPIGVLTLATTRLGGFTHPERAVLEDYAQRVAVAIANARIIESERLARERAEAARRRLTFQSRVSALFAQSLEWENALAKLMKLVTTSICDSAAIFTVERAAQSIRFVAAAAHSAELGTKIAEYFVDFPPQRGDRVGAGQAVRTARSQFFSNAMFAPSADPSVTARQRELSALWAPVSAIFVPLQAKGAEVGVIMLVRDISQKPFNNEDVAVAEDVARRTAIYMENARLYEREHGIAWALQQALLPAELPAVADVLFAVRYFAGAVGMDVGGDWYDIIDVSPDRMVITIGDVVGRGVQAAAAMGQYRAILRAYTFERFGPAAALTRLNDLVHALRGEAFATCTIIVLDPKAHRMHYASAGHPPPMLRLPSGAVVALDGASSMPIGAWPGTKYIEKTLDMPIGATLVLYTDGLVETRHRSAADGVDVLRAALTGSPPDIELMLDRVLRDVAPDRSDDIAILAVELLPLQSDRLKRWVFRGIDRSIMDTIRHEFEAMLEAHATADSDTYGARLILSELLSNVVRHAPGSFRLELDWSGEYAQLCLYDNGPGFASRGMFTVPDDILSISGRGLFLISQLSRSFTMTPRASGGLATRVVLPVRHTTDERELALR